VTTEKEHPQDLFVQSQYFLSCISSQWHFCCCHPQQKNKTKQNKTKQNKTKQNKWAGQQMQGQCHYITHSHKTHTTTTTLGNLKEYKVHNRHGWLRWWDPIIAAVLTATMWQWMVHYHALTHCVLLSLILFGIARCGMGRDLCVVLDCSACPIVLFVECSERRFPFAPLYEQYIT
jgi:hypothetical protein